MFCGCLSRHSTWDVAPSLPSLTANSASIRSSNGSPNASKIDIVTLRSVSLWRSSSPHAADRSNVINIQYLRVCWPTCEIWCVADVMYTSSVYWVTHVGSQSNWHPVVHDDHFRRETPTPLVAPSEHPLNESFRRRQCRDTQELCM